MLSDVRCLPRNHNRKPDYEMAADGGKGSGDVELLKQDRRPLYVLTAERLEAFIETSGFHTGDQLPAEAMLAQRMGVARSTVREALRELELRGRVTRIRGRGTIIARLVPIRTGLETLESLESLAERQGWTCRTEGVSVEEVAASPELAEILNVLPDARLTRLTRTKTRDWVPIGYMTTWLEASTFSADLMRARFRSSIIDLLLEQDDGGSVLDYASAQVGAVAAPDTVATALRISVGTPLIALTETFFDHSNSPVCHSINLFIPESIRLETIRRPAGSWKR
jgi:GntR family transcriptional regulator